MAITQYIKILLYFVSFFSISSLYAEAENEIHIFDVESGLIIYKISGGRVK